MKTAQTRPGAVGGTDEAARGRHVGNIKLAPIDRHRGLGTIGLLIGEPTLWGQGIASEAIGLVAGLAQRQLGLRKLIADCSAGNVGSCKAFARAGFEIEGRRRAHCLLDGQPEDLLLLARWLT